MKPPQLDSIKRSVAKPSWTVRRINIAPEGRLRSSARVCLLLFCPVLFCSGKTSTKTSVSRPLTRSLFAHDLRSTLADLRSTGQPVGGEERGG